jgi:hypothetical protein
LRVFIPLRVPRHDVLEMPPAVVGRLRIIGSQNLIPRYLIPIGRELPLGSSRQDLGHLRLRQQLLQRGLGHLLRNRPHGKMSHFPTSKVFSYLIPIGQELELVRFVDGAF